MSDAVCVKYSNSKNGKSTEDNGTRVSSVNIVEHPEIVMRNSIQPSEMDGMTELSHQNSLGDGHIQATSKDKVDGIDVFSQEAFEPLLTSNQYQVRKLAAQALMDVALMMANISQLRTLVALGPTHSQNFYLMTTMVACSLVCQVLFAILMFIILIRETDMQQKKDYLDSLKMFEENGLSKQATAQVRQSVLDGTRGFKHQRVTGHLNYITMVLVFLITVLNMFITGFGIKNTD